MPIHIAVEDMEPDHWIAWAIDLPVCFSSATTAADAVAHAPQKITEYFSWLLAHDPGLPAVIQPIEVEVIETSTPLPAGRTLNISSMPFLRMTAVL
jgi:hypothetical protein